MKKIIAGILCLLMVLSLFSGCGKKSGSAYVPTGDALVTNEEDITPQETEPAEEQKLTLCYYPDRTMNPFLSSDFTNRALFSLLYQGLFSVDRDYRVNPVLCKSYTMTENMLEYVFYVEDNVKFTDGSLLTPEDVLASFQTALESGIYEGRFYFVADVWLTEDKGIGVSLYHPYENFPLLLDFPILKATQLAEDYPAGTGPYQLSKTIAGPKLVRRNGWWCDTDLVVTAPSIDLVEAESNAQIRDEFEFEDLDLVCADPGSDYYADFRCDYELWECETGIFLYLAVKSDSKVFSSTSMKTALTYAIDREALVDTFYRGYARAATLPASPQSPYYSASLAKKYSYDKLKFAEAVAGSGERNSEIKLLVNSDDSLRVRVARAIIPMLEEGGLSVELVEKSGFDYEYELYWGEYDLYLGQTQLSKNMDLSQFYFEWGALSFGGINDEDLYELSLDALSNSGNYYTLHQQVMENGGLCPILFRNYAIFASRGILSELHPARDNIFSYHVRGKTIDSIFIPAEY